MKVRMLLEVLVALLLGAAVARAEDVAAIKARMAERLATVNDLKARKVIGETSTGYLAFVGAAKEKEDVVNAENADRKLIYEFIAQQLKSTADEAGKARARDIAQKSAAGLMLQDDTGKWYEKK